MNRNIIDGRGNKPEAFLHAVALLKKRTVKHSPAAFNKKPPERLFDFRQENQILSMQDRDLEKTPIPAPLRNPRGFAKPLASLASRAEPQGP